MAGQYRLVINGGVLSPAELKNICEVAEDMGMSTISFGSRQDIIFSEQIQESELHKLKDFNYISPQEADRKENIVSSYVSADIFSSTSWLTGDRYLYILEQFRVQPKLKVNITDPKQRLVPLFNGHINFIASDHEDYWHLYIRLPYWDENEVYPALIYSWDMDKIVYAIEEILQEEAEDIQTVFELVSDAVSSNNRTIDKALNVPFYPFPYYEGMNRLGTDSYWLGLYWRNNHYDLRFLKAMCELCAENKIGKITITPWKSFIVKGIPAHSKLQWEKLLGKFGINVRHSLLEMNWHLPVNNKDAIELKKYLVSIFDQNDISTYGLTFGITDYIRKGYYFTSIVIEKNKQPDELSKLKLQNTYNLLYAKNFDPNTRDYIMHVQEVDREDLPQLLIELSRLYFEQLGEKNEAEKTLKPKKETKQYEVYQCQSCLTVYNEIYGDITQNIPANTPFNELPKSYCCSLCEAPLINFKKKTILKNS